MAIAFLKVEGLGNDFLLVDARQTVPVPFEVVAERAPQLCDRRRGVGGDGVLWVGPPRSPGASATMIVINHDGSRPEMCGNGLRTVALVVAADLGRDEVTIDTDAGPRHCLVRVGPPRERPVGPGLEGDVVVDMGPGRDDGPARVDAFARPFSRVSMGNPHAIVFTEADEDPEGLARAVGPAVERAPAFPDGTNVEFCAVTDDGLRLWVWERGCGITDACGTGACATAYAAAHAGLIAFDAPTTVRLPGGPLQITVPTDASAGIRMEGPARVVFAGTTD
mgnify:CR=1 FL=1